MVRALLINATDALGHHGCTLVNRQILTLAREAGIDITARAPLSSDWLKQSASDFDCVLVNGEGTLHSDSKGAKRISQVPSWAERIGRPAFLFNSIFQDNSLDLVDCMRGFKGIWVRDMESLKNLQSWDVSACYAPDLTLSWYRKDLHISRSGIIVQDSTIRDRRKMLFDLSKQIQASYIPLISRPAKDVLGKNLFRRVKFSIKKSLNFVLPDEEERVRYKNAIPSFDTFVHKMSCCKMIITGRFHGIALALTTRTPFIAFSSNSRKVEVLLESLDMGHRLAQNKEDARILLNSDQIMRFSNAELSAIEKLHNEARRASQNMFSSITCKTRELVCI